MALEGLIDSETEEKIYQKQQKRDRFMHNFNSEAAVSMPGLGYFKTPVPTWFTVRDRDMQGKLDATWICVPFINVDNYTKAGRIDVIYDQNPKVVEDQVNQTAKQYAQGPPFKSQYDTEVNTYDWVSDPSMLATALTKQLFNITRWDASTITKIGTGFKYPGGTTTPSTKTTTTTPPKGVPAKNGGKGGKVGSVSTSKSGCFIATAAMSGTPFERDIAALRNFRDDALPLPMVELYYRHSPKIADRIRDSEVLRGVTRILLMPLVKVTKWRYGVKRNAL